MDTDSSNSSEEFEDNCPIFQRINPVTGICAYITQIYTQCAKCCPSEISESCDRTQDEFIHCCRCFLDEDCTSYQTRDWTDYTSLVAGLAIAMSMIALCCLWKQFAFMSKVLRRPEEEPPVTFNPMLTGGYPIPPYMIHGSGSLQSSGNGRTRQQPTAPSPPSYDCSVTPPPPYMEYPILNNNNSTNNK